MRLIPYAGYDPSEAPFRGDKAKGRNRTINGLRAASLFAEGLQWQKVAERLAMEDGRGTYDKDAVARAAKRALSNAHRSIKQCEIKSRKS